MAFIAPLFLVGLLAIALPFWLHRLQAQSSIRKPFSSAMLLESTEQRVHTQKKLKYFTLLALRVALLLLLAVAFAKPLLFRPPGVQSDAAAGTHLIVVDTSASMGRTGVFAQALAAAQRVVDDVPDAAIVQIIAADGGLYQASELSADKGLHRAALPALSVSALRLNYGEMLAAIDRLAASLPAPVSLHLISDFQATAMPQRFSALVSTEIASFSAYPVGSGEPFNWSVQQLRETAEGVEVVLSGVGDRERLAEVELLLNGVVTDQRGLSGTGPQTMRFTLSDYAEGDNQIVIRILADDDLAIDNERYHVIERSVPTEVPLITYNVDGLPVTYLSAALQSAAGNRFVVQTLLAGEFDTRVLSRYSWLVVDDIGSLDPEMERALTEFLSGGGNLLAFAGERTMSRDTVPISGHRHSPSTTSLAGNQFLSVGQVDAGHALLSQTEGWHNINFSRSMPVEPLAGDQVLIRLENNEPFLIERKIGDGTLLLVLGGLDNRWNDLPLHPVFVSFIVESARYLSGARDISKSYIAGATLPLALVGSISGQVVDPLGNSVLSLADTTREQQIKLHKPGFYTVYTTQGELSVAVNVDPAESDLKTIPQNVLARWQDAAGNQDTATLTVSNETTAQEPRATELWHWLLLLMTLVIIAESVLGNTYLTPRRAGAA